MLNILQATDIVHKSLPNGRVQAVVDYRNLYLFQIFTDDPFEEEMDPFYSVDKNTGEFSEFSILEDGNIDEIFALFQKPK